MSNLGSSEEQTRAAATPTAEHEGGPGMVRLGIGLMLINITTYLAIFAVLNVLLPAQIATAAGEGGKEAALGVITTLGAIAAMIAGPVWGALSDRHTSRLGRRGAWILAGAAAALVTLNMVGASQTLLIIGLGWVLSQLAVNATLMGFSTVIPERVPLARRGLMSGVVGIATGLAITLAAVVGAAFISAPLTGTMTLSVLALVGAIAFLVIAPEPRTEAAVPAERPAVLSSMLSSLRNSSDFRWTWVGRFLVVLGYYLLQARMLYFIQSSLQLDVAAAAGVVAQVAAIGGVTMIAGLVVAAPLSDKFGRKPFVYGAGVGIALGLVMMSASSTTTSITIANAVIGLAFGAFMGVDQALVADVLPNKEDVAKDLGVINLAATIPQMLAPAVGSAILLTSGGSYSLLLIIGAVIAACSVYATWRIRGVR
ncbi:MAG TPA: MFS transporter [Dermatophilaceae bacterium]|jgi:MFS family permease|nr:MFS transporter [Dermatophilaceae bacterium]